MKKSVFLFIISLIIIFAGIVDAGNFGIGVHSGYGVIKYEEQSSAFGNQFESSATQNMVIFGVSGEYSFPRPHNFYANITTDWVLGLEDVERWKENNIQIQTTDMSVFSQFYDFRFGYKNARDNLYYSFYVSGGLDSMHFKRDKYLWRGTPVTGIITEDIYLWRTGMGTGVGYKLGKWALDGRFAYAFYPVAKVNNSSLPQFTFNTNGTVLDTGLGLSREVTQNVNCYFGGSYSLLKLEQSDIMRNGSIQAFYPGSKTEIMAGMVNLTFAF